MKTIIGGDRLGSGSKMEISGRNYERSSHDRSYKWRSSAASGTLMPFMCELGLPGDSFDIDLDFDAKTHPTIGPLFGSWKAQLDIFQVPIRLYNSKLHMNALGVGLDMKKIKIPQIEVKTYFDGDNPNEEQIEPSSILSYLNIRGVGRTETGNSAQIKRYFNAIPYLAMFDIYKNYYANKQEEVGMIIHNTIGDLIPVSSALINNTDNCYNTTLAINVYENSSLHVGLTTWTSEENPNINAFTITTQLFGDTLIYPNVFQNYTWDSTNKKIIFTNPRPDIIANNGNNTFNVPPQGIPIDSDYAGLPIIKSFPLDNIDQMREDILKADGETQFNINSASIEPYGLVLQKGNGDKDYSSRTKLEGLLLKTYQSDLFNNWINTEWIDGTNGINEITAIDTSGGNFTIDNLIIMRKVYDMLNRIAVSGGTYQNWLEANYEEYGYKTFESPMYLGGMIREIAFQEVISNAAAKKDGQEQPLGELAGRGIVTNYKKGGSVKVRINEPSYIIGIVSLTPRIDYSQGNKWDVNFKTLNDLHVPAMDAIGWQDLITDQMAYLDTTSDNDGITTFKSAGKQPSWINYMTNVNQIRGNFALEEEGFMVLNRNYEIGINGIEDLTTYVDPSKFNQIFADTKLDAQNFWLQIAVDIHYRGKISAKQIPNL